MASGLRAKLNMMRSSAPVEATPRRGGLICHVTREPLDPAILDLPSTGLRRIGWCGPRFDIRRCLFLDTETTGLSGGAGTVAFLVGVGYVEGEALVIEQYPALFAKAVLSSPMLGVALGKIPAPGVGDTDGPGISKQKLDAMGYRDRLQYASKHPDEYQKLMGR